MIQTYKAIYGSGVIRLLTEVRLKEKNMSTVYPVRRFSLAAMVTAFASLASGQAVVPAVPVPAGGAMNVRAHMGPLHVCRSNPRYFADASGHALFLTGSHTWPNFQDTRVLSPAAQFDFNAYLAFLQAHHHNFIRLWHWELPFWKEDDAALAVQNSSTPHPWRRVGLEMALDGKPKFDLAQFDPVYFERLRERVVAARERGIYISVMLFEGWAMQFIKQAWQAHPFHPGNHIGTLAGPAANAQGLEIYEMKYPAITAVQEAYVRKVIETVGDLDNVLYEISNENHPGSTEWQYHFIRFIKQVEAARHKSHPVGMVWQYRGGDNATLWASPADWITPGQYWPSDEPRSPWPEATQAYRDDPTAADGRKVVFLDTDHLWGVGGNALWVWKSLARGHNVLCMDQITALTGYRENPAAHLEDVRLAMGDARRYAERMDLSHAIPQSALASTGYCLARKGREYLAVQPETGAFTVRLAAGKYRVEWFDIGTRHAVAAPAVQGGSAVPFTPPFAGAAVLFLKQAP